MSSTVAYSNHIGTNGRNGGKDNSISNASALKAAEKHANHDYSEEEVKKMESNIDLSQRHLNRLFECHDGKLMELFEPNKYLELERLVKKAYHKHFDSAISEFNERMKKEGKPKKVIEDYFDTVSKNPIMQLVTQGILQIADHETWRGKSQKMRERASDVLIKLLMVNVNMINERADGEFVLVGAAIHLNESSPHVHYYGICVQRDFKRDKPSSRVSKSSIFNKETLTLMQTEVRDYAEVVVYKEFGWTFNTKMKGRNKDYTKTQLLFIKEQQNKMIEEAKMIERAISEENAFKELINQTESNADDSYCLVREPVIEIKDEASILEEVAPKKEKVDNNDNLLQRIIEFTTHLFLQEKKRREKEKEETQRLEKERLAEQEKANQITLQLTSPNNALSKNKKPNLWKTISAAEKKSTSSQTPRDNTRTHERER